MVAAGGVGTSPLFFPSKTHDAGHKLQLPWRMNYFPWFVVLQNKTAIFVHFLIAQKPMFEKSKEEYNNLPESEWIGQWFSETSGGYIAAHRFKTVDDINRPGIVAEIKGCRALAILGKHVLRLPENVANLIDTIVIEGKQDDNAIMEHGASFPMFIACLKVI
jgi:hypothetical protein